MHLKSLKYYRKFKTKASEHLVPLFATHRQTICFIAGILIGLSCHFIVTNLFLKRHRIRERVIFIQNEEECILPNINATLEEQMRAILKITSVLPPLDMKSRQRPFHTIGNINHMGRLGNLMFQYASMLAIGRRRNLVPIVKENDEMFSVFKGLTAVKVDTISTKRMVTFREKLACTYDVRTARLSNASDWLLAGFFQSWKYFYWMKDEIRLEFNMLDHIKEAAHEFLEKVDKTREQKTYIGVHIRRGDMLNKDNYGIGYRMAPPGYISRAIEYYRKRYDDAVFVVCSDDIKWAQKILRRQKNVYFSVGKNQYVDFAILSSCNHTIQTVGTFGWWAAFLAGGENVYYSRPIAPGSRLWETYSLPDFFLPEWIGMV